MTDGELAVRLALEKGSDDITIMGGREGRLDHILSSVDLLYLIPESRKARLYYLEDLVHLLREGEELEVDDPDKVYSVLPGDRRCVVSEIGFKWPLESKLLEKGTTRGIHNQLSDEKGIIKAEAGDLIVIICRDRFTPSRFPEGRRDTR
jgi:thiamine pyrophosphokinase